MKLCRLVIAVLASCFSVAASAEPISTVLQLYHGFGSRSVTRISLRLISTDLDNLPHRGAALPLYSSDTRTPKWYPMRSGEEQRPFCERSPNGCLAFGMLLGVGIVYFVVEAANDAEGDAQISFTSGGGRVTVNNPR